MAITIDAALDLARTAGRGEAARVEMSRAVFGNARLTRGLRRRILAATTPENRALFAFHFGDDAERADAWGLLISFAGSL